MDDLSFDPPQRQLRSEAEMPGVSRSHLLSITSLLLRNLSAVPGASQIWQLPVSQICAQSNVNMSKPISIFVFLPLSNTTCTVGHFSFDCLYGCKRLCQIHCYRCVFVKPCLALCSDIFLLVFV